MTSMAFTCGTCLCVRGIPASCHESDLNDLFRSYGRVVNVRIPVEPVSKGNRGYAFVTVTSSAEAQACIAALNDVEFSGCRLSVDISKRSAPHVKTPGVYLGSANRRHDGPSAAAASPTGLAPSCERKQVSPRPAGHRADAMAEPLSEPAAAMPAAVRHGRSEPLIEPVTEPGGEPLIEEDPMCGADKEDPLCGADKRPKASKVPPESPRSRISRLESANIRAVAKQTLDSLIIQFQQQGFSDPRAASRDCLKVSVDLLGRPPTSVPTVPAEAPGASPSPQVLLSPDEFKNPSSFLRVYGDPLVGAAPRCGGWVPELHQDGNWRCDQCSNVNFPRRQRCHKCHALRSPNGDAIVLQYCLRVYEMLLKAKTCD
mmetsp:Transcript_76118/g.215258  ORF Transcript_76118/g.215258 Transcript_76118/m.215258 type:complete len:372 (-) Transcript_76118:107-1222(-)